MRDHEIIAILEGCDEAQRARVMAWARKRWPVPKKGAKTAPARPDDTAREEAMRRFVEAIKAPPEGWRLSQEARDLTLGRAVDPGTYVGTYVTRPNLSVDPGASWPLTQTRPSWAIRNGDPS